MSTELIANKQHPFDLTRYSGGSEKGMCVQVTGPNCDGPTGYIGLNRTEAVGLAADLLQFALAKELEKELL